MREEDIPFIPYVTFMPMAADIIPHKHSVGDNMAALTPIIVIITVTQFTIHNQLPPITICGSCDLVMSFIIL